MVYHIHSGCITSAEAVLIQEQSYSKLYDKLSQNSSLVIVAISPQSLASIAALTSMEIVEVFLRVASLLKRIGVHYVMDMSAVGDVSLIETREEFMMRYRNGHHKNTSWISPASTSAISSTRQIAVDQMQSLDPNTMAPGIEIGNLPMIASSCPGWICFAEKTQPQSLPYISSTKSPQQLLGSIIKTVLFSTKSHESSHKGKSSYSQHLDRSQ